MRWWITKTVILVMVSCATIARAEIGEFVETFDGRGPYESVDGEFDGLDNPEWSIFVDGIARLQDGGLHVGTMGMPEDGGVVILEKPISGSGSFIERVEIKNPDLGVTFEDDPVAVNSGIRLNHVFDVEESSNTAEIGIRLPRGHNHAWELGLFIENSQLGFDLVSKGDHLAFEIIYDAVLSRAYFTFDNDINDNVPAIEYGPFEHKRIAAKQQRSRLSFSAFGTKSREANGFVDFWSLEELVTPGDYDDDRLLTVADVDLLMTQVREGPFGESYDLNDDGTLDSSDVRVWVEDLKGTWLGDANLDGEFNSSDLVQIFENGQYEDGIALNSTWATGDWNADAEFDSGDLVFAFAGGGYEIGPREAAAIPEPSTLVSILIGALMLVRFRR